MKNNFLQLSILEMNNSLVTILGITLFSIFLLVIFGYFFRKIERLSLDTKRFIRFAFRTNVVSGIICSAIILAINVDDFTKLVEKESISEIQYSKKAEFKKRLINSLYIYIMAEWYNVYCKKSKLRFF